ncbi:MAG: hypothetical protein ACREUD_00170 [Gammaproteobacteria bacterium]
MRLIFSDGLPFFSAPCFLAVDALSLTTQKQMAWMYPRPMLKTLVGWWRRYFAKNRSSRSGVIYIKAGLSLRRVAKDEFKA